MDRRGFLGILAALGVTSLVDPLALLGAQAPISGPVHTGMDPARPGTECTVIINGQDVSGHVFYAEVASAFDITDITQYGQSTYSYVPGIMLTRFNTEIANAADWIPRLDGPSDIEVHTYGVVYAFRAYIENAQMTEDRIRCAWGTDGNLRITQKKVLTTRK